MEITVIDSGKDHVEITIDNPTIAEVLRAYLNEAGISFAAWRREHPSKPVIMRIESSNGTVKKAISDAVAAIQKDLDALTSLAKKSN